MSAWAGNGNNWVHTVNKLPPEGVLVDTISEGGISQQMTFKSNLWWTGDTYVYYVPRLWRHING